MNLININGRHLEIRAASVLLDNGRYIGFPCVRHINRDNDREGWLVRINRFDEPLLNKFFYDYESYKDSYLEAFEYLAAYIGQYRDINRSLNRAKRPSLYCRTREYKHGIANQYRLELHLFSIRQLRKRATLHLGATLTMRLLNKAELLLLDLKTWYEKVVRELGRKSAFKVTPPLWYEVRKDEVYDLRE